jgi:hypothetical protein
MRNILKLFKRYYPLLLGALGGYLYYYFIGCASGACPITGNPYISIMYGGLIGAVMTLGNKRKEE